MIKVNGDAEENYLFPAHLLEKLQDVDIKQVYANSAEHIFFAKLHNIHNQSIKSLKVSNASSLQSLTMPEDPATIELNELGQRAGGSSPPIMVRGNAKRNTKCVTANANNTNTLKL